MANPKTTNKCVRCGHGATEKCYVGPRDTLHHACTTCIKGRAKCGDCQTPLFDPMFISVYKEKKTQQVPSCGKCWHTYQYACVMGCGHNIHTKHSRYGCCEQCILKWNTQEAHYFFQDGNTLASNGRHNIIPFKRRFGVELESSGLGVRKDQTQFSAIRDGSITGQEFVSPILQGDSGADAIRELCDLGPTTDGKCGFHLHLDATDLSWSHLLQIGRGYTLIQPILWAMMPKNRRANPTCLLIQTPYFAINTRTQILGALYAKEGDIRRAKHRKRVEKRYEFFNAHSYFYHGTIEIRLHQGTFVYDDIINWINLNQALFAYFLRTNVGPMDNPFTHFTQAIAEQKGLLDYVKKKINLYKYAPYVPYLDNPTTYKHQLLPSGADNEQRTDQRLQETMDIMQKIDEMFPNTRVQTGKQGLVLQQIFGLPKPVLFKPTDQPPEPTPKKFNARLRAYTPPEYFVQYTVAQDPVVFVERRGE